MLKPEFTGQFKRDYKLALKRGCDPKKLNEVVMLLCKEEPLPEAYRDHALVNSRNYKGMRECHIQPDWLLVYKVIHETLILELIRTGSHSETRFVKVVFCKRISKEQWGCHTSFVWQPLHNLMLMRN